MKKRLLMILTVAVLLVGCGNQQEANNPSTDQTNTTESTTTNEPTSTEAPITTEEPTDPPHEHAYTESTSKEATCNEAGEKTFTCDCGDTYTEPIKETGHDYKTVAGSEVKATCEVDGKKADTKCSLCDDTIKGANVSATGHSYGKYTYNNDATYEKDGTETATCSACGKTKTRTKEGTKLEKEESNATMTLDDAIAYASSKYPLYQTVDNGGNNVQTYILCCTGTLTAEEVQRLNDLGTNAEVGTARLVRDRGYGNGRSTLTNLEFFGENNKFIIVKIDFSTTTP